MSSLNGTAASFHLNGENNRRGLASVSERNVQTQFFSFRKSPEKKSAAMSYSQLPTAQGSRQSPLLKAGALQNASQSFYQAPSHSRESGNSLRGSSWSSQKHEILRDKLASTESPPKELRSRESSRMHASREREHKPSGLAIDFGPKFDDFHSDEDKGEEDAENNLGGYKKDIWADLKLTAERLTILYHKLTANLDEGRKYSMHISTYNAIHPRRDYKDRLHAISRTTLSLNQALRDKITLHNVVHGGDSHGLISLVY